MAEIGTTAGNRKTYVDGNGYDNAKLVFPYDDNTVINITGDLTGAVTAQFAGNTDTPQNDWGNNMHDLVSGSRRGQGNIPVVRGSDTDKLFQQIFNACHPLSDTTMRGAEMVQNHHKFLFTLILWNSDELDSDGNAVKYTKCDNTLFTSQPATNINDGTTNSEQPMTWAYATTELSRHMGDPESPNMQVPDLSAASNNSSK